MSTRNNGAGAERRRRGLPAMLGRSALAVALLCSVAVVQAADCPPLRGPLDGV
jgi:hypothetical protein